MARMGIMPDGTSSGRRPTTAFYLTPPGLQTVTAEAGLLSYNIFTHETKKLVGYTACRQTCFPSFFRPRRAEDFSAPAQNKKLVSAGTRQ